MSTRIFLAQFHLTHGMWGCSATLQHRTCISSPTTTSPPRPGHCRAGDNDTKAGRHRRAHRRPRPGREDKDIAPLVIVTRKRDGTALGRYNKVVARSRLIPSSTLAIALAVSI
ncbi:hypothetical protein BD779DRAFT_1474701 [Infundibulicybe gibba]|nr:hypothetical protein BD779DRAFT_1474701 [Infundibulicybe gibba]